MIPYSNPEWRSKMASVKLSFQERASTAGHAVIIEAYDRAFTNFRREFVNMLEREGYAVTAVAPEFSKDVIDHLNARGIRHESVKFSRGSVNPVRETEAIRGLERKLSELSPDLVYAFGPKPVIYSGLARTTGSATKVGVITGLGYGFTAKGSKARMIRRVQTALYRKALKRTTAVLFQNADDKWLFEKQGILAPGRTGTGVVNGSGVDLHEFRSAPPPQHGMPTFLFVGRLQSSKGFEDFARAAEIATRSGIRARFKVVGWRDSENPEAVDPEYLENLIAAGVLEFVGRSNDVRGELEGCNVLVLPSMREGTPRSVLEALAVGRAVITTDVPGCRETVVDGWNGILVQPGKPYEIASAMFKYFQDDQLAAVHGRNGRELAELKYDVHDVNQDLLAAGQRPDKVPSALRGTEFRTLDGTQVKFTADEARVLAALHRAAFPEFFMSSLGVPFLTQFYLGYRDDPDAIVAVERDERGEISGIAVGTSRPEGFFKRLLMQRFFGFALAGLRAVLRKPHDAPRLLRGLFYRGDQPKDSSGALLSSISVSPNSQGRGVGRKLLGAWCDEAASKGVRTAYLTTDAFENDRTNHFYKRSGWAMESSFTTPEGRRMNRYRKDIINGND